LPLQNLSGDPNQDYFADGMTDALITDLAQTRSLRVISKTSSDRYRKTQKKLSEIAKELNVDAVVEGAVLRSGDQVRIDAQLIRAEDDQHLWARSYDRKISDVLSLQADVAQAIASEIEVKLAPEQQSPRPPARPVNAQAYEAYLKGAYFYGGEEQDLEKAIKYFQKSADLDPTYVPAYLGLGESYGTMAYLEAGTIPPAEAWLKSEINIAKALELDPKSSLAHNQLGMNRLLHHCDRPGAEKELNLALELDPSDMHSLDYHSFYLLEVGRSDQAIAEKRRVLDHDPVSVITKSEFGMYLSTVGRLDEAIQQFQDTLELDPNSGMTRMRLGSAYADQHHYEQAVVQMKKALAIERRPRWLGRLGWVYARWGKASESLELIKELKELSKHGDVSPSLIARIYAVLGEKEQALIWLEKAKGDYPGTSDDGFDSLRSDPRFKVLEARLKPEESCLGF
jgi:TolB-like protein/Tfp pilus assembly protein PilF